VKQWGKKMNDLDLYLKNSQQDLEKYIELLKKWQKAVNLISFNTLPDIWKRHILDSAQLYPLISMKNITLADMGSGAGFPALVLAILNKNNNGPIKKMFLIESDMKKTLFLKEVVRELGLPVQILNKRIEHIKDIKADVLTARALSSLFDLLILGKNFIYSKTTCLFLKGENYEKEIKNCSISCKIEKIKSITNSNSSVLKITEVLYD
jgi:16S rRNA (guanine527-N7)-methyltransferase